MSDVSVNIVEENDIVSFLIEEHDGQIDIIVVEEHDDVTINISENQGNGSFTPLPLIVTSNGQTSFNIFNMPDGYNELDINGVTYYENDDYEFIISGLNIYLSWLNNFSLQITDKLIFKTF